MTCSTESPLAGTQVIVPRLSEAEIESEIQRKGLTAPRVTPAEIEALVDGLDYWIAHIEGTTTTIAVAFDQNGFSVATGLSACASPENFDKEIGEQIALQNAETNARAELWRLEGYRLKRNLMEGSVTPSEYD